MAYSYLTGNAAGWTVDPASYIYNPSDAKVCLSLPLKLATYPVNVNTGLVGGTGSAQGITNEVNVGYSVDNITYDKNTWKVKYTTIQNEYGPTASYLMNNIVINDNISTNSLYIYNTANIENSVLVNNIYTGCVVGTSGYAGWFVEPSKRDKLRLNLVPVIKSRANPIAATGNEVVALETLHQIITEAEFRKYLKYGFVLVKGASGATYQIFRNKSHTRVFVGGKLVEEICVRIKDATVPATDNVIAFKTMIEAGDEAGFRQRGNVYRMAA